MVNGRYVMAPSPIPKFDNPKMHRIAGAAAVRGRPREADLRRAAANRRSCSLDFEDHPFEVQRWDRPCALCGADDSYLDEVVTDDRGGRMFVCSDTDLLRAATRGRGRGVSEADDAPLLQVAGPRASRYGAACALLDGGRLRSLAGRGAGHRRRVRLGQDHAPALPRRPSSQPTPAACATPPATTAWSTCSALPEPQRRWLAAHRMGLRPPEPARRPAPRRHRRRQYRRAADGGRRAALRRASAPRRSDWLERVEIDPARIDDRPRTFSGGMQQRLQIARNLVTHRGWSSWTSRPAGSTSRSRRACST